MGGLPIDEPLLNGAMRELREETGLIADEWQELLRLDTSNSITNERAIVYVAKGLSHGVVEPDDTERLNIRVLPLDDAIQMAKSGEIKDAISVAALMHLGIS